MYLRFEPHPETFDTLRHQAILHGYSAFNLACGDQRSTLDLYDSLEDNGSPHASFYRDVIESLHRGRAVAHKVEVIVLDEFIAEQGIHSVDLVKIDTEGHELRVLAGLRKTISKDIIHVIQFEFNAMHVISRSFLRDFVELLPQYRLYRILRDGLVPLGEYSPVFCELYAFQNVVAIRKGYTLKV